VRFRHSPPSLSFDLSEPCPNSGNGGGINQKQPGPLRARLRDLTSRLQNGHVRCPLFASLVDHVKLDALALGQSPIAAGTPDASELNEHVLSVLSLDEAVAFGVVKPLDNSGHQRPPSR